MTDQPSDPFADLAPEDYALTFTPAPTRKRHAGWTELRQRRFILMLRETGTVASAARAAGLSVQWVYRLREQPGAEGFAAAWDRAIGDGQAMAFDRAMDRALNGYTIPRYYRGQLIGTIHRPFDDRMTIAALGYAYRSGRKLVGKRGRDESFQPKLHQLSRSDK